MQETRQPDSAGEAMPDQGNLKVFLGALAGVRSRSRRRLKRPQLGRARDYLVVLAAVCVSVLVAAALRPVLHLANLSLVFLVGVLLVAVRTATMPAVVAALAGAGAYNFFFTEPRYTFYMHQTEDLLTVVFFLIVGLVAGQLAGRLRQQLQALRATNEQTQRARVAEETERLRSALLSSVSHDLRTPLSSMIGSASTLRDLADDLSAADRSELLDAIITEGERLNRYIQNLLDMTRLGHGTLKIERDWIGLDDVVNAALRRTRAALRDVRVVRSLDRALPLLYVHPALIEQALVNVIENAARFSPEDGEIRITAELEGDEVHITISDQGPGIPAEERGKVFDMFFTGGDGDRGRHGGGLGLAIRGNDRRPHGAHPGAAGPGVRRHRHPHSPAGGPGTRFPAGGSVTADTGHRVLVIDDEVQIRRFLRISLASQGYQVIEADTAARGLELAATRTPDLVVLDLGLPDADGREVLSAIRGRSSVPVMVLSVRSSEAEKVLALDAGANDYVTKPFGIQEFLARLRNLLRAVADVGGEGGVFDDGSLRVDLGARRLTLRGEPVHLTPKEFRVLQQLLRHAGRVVTQTQLLKDIWGASHADDTHYLRIVIGKIRQKLHDDPEHPRYVETEPGVGYRFIGADGEGHSG